MDKLFNAKSFSEESNNVLIAPAGFGKTHSICECIKHTEGEQLILTHTQAGVASIKEKLVTSSISKDSYRVETISSFAQRYVFAFHNVDNIPDIINQSAYYSFLTECALEIFNLKPVQDVIRNSYAGLYVDEYQDCTIQQHELIKVLAKTLPTHLFGDPLQGIFGFSGQLVNLEDPNHMQDFGKIYTLETPHRWVKAGNPELGNDLLKIRKKLLSGLELNFKDYNSIEFKQGVYTNHYNFIIKALTSEKSILVIHPVSTQIKPRQMFVASFKYIPLLIESLDHSDFYRWAGHFDTTTESSANLCHDFLIANYTNLNNWYNKDNRKFKKKSDPLQEKQLTEIKQLHSELQLENSAAKIRQLLMKVKKLDNVNCSREDLLNSIFVALNNSCQNDSTVLDAMKSHRNVIRKMGRKLYGKCIGTTLLTKGLEFDAVIVLAADKFNDPKNLYVALSRCCKRLIIVSESENIKL